MPAGTPDRPGRISWGGIFGSKNAQGSSSEKTKPSKWSMGVLNDPETIEVPGSVLLLAAHRNEPLGLRNVHARTSHSSIPAGFPVEIPTTPGGTRQIPEDARSPTSVTAQSQTQDDNEEKKKTPDGQIILDPQPEDSANDPLNWPAWRRDVALLSLGFYCMIGGGITPILAAGFTNVAETYNVAAERVPLTTGLYMMGLGVGAVIVSPTAILYGKRPVYLMSSIIFMATCLWAAWSPSFNSLLAARVFQGITMSPVECLPSATIAEIFFLHERAFRVGIYTLLLLSGKNLVPLVSAAIIGGLSWRWVFWIVAMVVALGSVLLFFFVPETFWDRTPTRAKSKRPSILRRLSSHRSHGLKSATPMSTRGVLKSGPASPGMPHRPKDLHVGFASSMTEKQALAGQEADPDALSPKHTSFPEPQDSTSSAGEGQSAPAQTSGTHEGTHASSSASPLAPQPDAGTSSQLAEPAQARTPTSPMSRRPSSQAPYIHSGMGSELNVDYFVQGPNLDNEKIPASRLRAPLKVQAYTHNLRYQPAKSFTQLLKPWNGRLNNDKWLKVAVRPFILMIYPSVLWSSVIYACSIGWLIVISELLASIFRDPDTYKFTALQTGLIYISPFIGSFLGTAVAGKISDIIVKAMTRRNGGLYEPEFRLVMAIPILITTCIGLMGFGWSASVDDPWIVPTVFFGIISFGCSLGSTTSITFCVDSYRQYAGEALVSLNFIKNICHGLVFSLFVADWLDEDGTKTVFIWIGVIQLIVCLTSIPMYIYGKRARMWTARKNFMERF